MAKNELKVLARMTFVADKTVQNMRKCLEKKGDLCQFKAHPAIEPDSGLMMATNGHILAVHKLKDYRCELGDGVFVMNGVHMVPAEVTKMKGVVTVEILSDTYDEFVRVSDSQGATAELKQESRYPVWRSVMPWSSGYPVTVDAKAWDAVLKDMQAAADRDCPMRICGERDGRTVRLSHYDDIADKEWSRDVEVGRMPYKMFASFNCRRLRDVMAFQPTGMRFVENTRPVMFTGDETLVLLMPLLGSLDLTCKIGDKDYERFDLAKWMMAGKKEDARGKKADVKPQTSSVSRQPSGEPTLAERLRAVLLAQMKQAA